MTGRSVPEWIGATPDSAIPKAVKLRIWERYGGRCAITGRKLQVGDAYDFDHILPLALGGEHRETNIQLVSREAHKEKTREDVGRIRKADRQGLKFRGLWPETKHKIPSRRFSPSRTRKHAEDVNHG